ncbi:MAG: 3-keto-5-aminohexanoate cleavage protein [Candidatus Thorarchaeota archaeon]|jgi:3-keto-5-aminohexanoate cleavage enzyme
MEKLIITIAPTGSVPRKRDTEYLPLTPDEIADTAYLCEQEGASIIHVHCRDEHENPTSDYQTFKETVESTSGIAGTSNEERAEPLKTNPEMASLTTGSLNFTGRKPPVVYMNSWETIVHLARTMSELNIKPEMEAFDVGFIHQGIKLLLFQLVMGVDGGIPATTDNLLHMIRQLPQGAPFTVAGIGKRQLKMITTSIALGGHVRVGLEDNIYYVKGKLAANEEFVARASNFAETLGREVATPDKARTILELNTAKRPQ